MVKCLLDVVHNARGQTAPIIEQRTTKVASFWSTVLRIEGLWNSPLRVEVLRILATTILFVLGIVAGRLWGMWRRYRQLRIAERGESEDVVTIEKIILDRCPDGREVLRIRSCGRDPIETVFPNQVARDEFQSCAGKTTTAYPLVSMEGKMGSYLLQELAIWVCGQLRERNFRHEVWVMAPVYERGALYLGGHFLDCTSDPARRPATFSRLAGLRNDPGRTREPWRTRVDALRYGRRIREASEGDRQSTGCRP